MKVKVTQIFPRLLTRVGQQTDLYECLAALALDHVGECLDAELLLSAELLHHAPHQTLPLPLPQSVLFPTLVSRAAIVLGTR